MEDPAVSRKSLEIFKQGTAPSKELIAIAAHWVENRFEVRQMVRAARALAIRGEVRVPLGSPGEVLNLEREEGCPVLYHVHFDCLPGNPLQVPEAALTEWTGSDG